MTEWAALVEKLARSIKPNKLSLYLYFRETDMSAVKAVLEPLAALPTLQDCGIWVRLSLAESQAPVVSF